jgi:hypothetical protein
MNFDEMLVAKLEELLEEIKYMVDCHESNVFGRESFGMILGLSETMLVRNGINCKNLAFQLTSNEKAMKLVDRISLKRRLSLSPEYQLGLMVMSTTYILHKSNEIKEDHTVRSNRRTSSDIVNEYSDLDIN